MKPGDKAPCGCTYRPDNIPLASLPVTTIQLVCSHGISDPKTPVQLLDLSEMDEFHAAQMVAYATAAWMGEEFQGDHLKGWLLNWDTDTEFALRMTDSGPGIQWNRCGDAEHLIDAETVAWEFHSGLFLWEWTLEMISRESGGGITVIDLN